VTRGGRLATRVLAGALGALLAAATAVEAGVSRDPVDLLNVALSPRYAGWLIGPYGRLASDQEIRQYLGLSSDDAAADFISSFWERRNPHPGSPDNAVRDLAEQRVTEADRRFSEGGVPGRRTDRGTTFVLYGEPDKIEFEPSQLYGEPPLEVWSYPADAPKGLDGKKPKRSYRFVKRGDLTVFYVRGRPGRFTQGGPGGPLPDGRP
jgi:GWxTD domain-containing protein